jgi:hypothetical protein
MTVVGIARGYWLDVCGSILDKGHSGQTGLAPIPWVPEALFAGTCSRQVRSAVHSPPSSDEVKNEWSYALTPQYVFKL